MVGKRVEDFKPLHLLQPGEYTKYPHERENFWWPGKSYWAICTPNGLIGNLVNHIVRENPDGTITVQPEPESSNSILVTGEKTWHGYIDRGTWREC